MSFYLAAYFISSPRVLFASANSGFLANRRRAALRPGCFAALHATLPKKPIADVDRSYGAPAVALSQVRRTDGGRRTGGPRNSQVEIAKFGVSFGEAEGGRRYTLRGAMCSRQRPVYTACGSPFIAPLMIWVLATLIGNADRLEFYSN